jgi:hypothetical protein
MSTRFFLSNRAKKALLLLPTFATICIHTAAHHTQS